MSVSETTSAETLFVEASQFLGLEARLIDDKAWHDWLDLYSDDARFWVPAWNGDDEMTDDPARQVSLIWANRTELQARVFRIEGEDSYASMPLPHTVHIVTCTGVEALPDGGLRVRANAMVNAFWRTLGPTWRACRYEYELVRAGSDFRIRQKKIIVLDDRVVGAIDIYSI